MPLPRSLVLASLLLLAPSLQAQVVHEPLTPHAIRFFADAAAQKAALPSYALLDTIKPLSSSATPTVTPAFSEAADHTHSATIHVEPGTSLYGTGEVAGPLLRNGRKVSTWNTDAYGYTEKYDSLYQSHPWVLAVRADGTAFGALADTTYRCTIDTAATHSDQIIFSAPGPAFPVVVITGDTPQEVVSQLSMMTGTMPMPPKWAVGYHQCRFSYYPEAKVREIADGFRSRKIPCDVIWYDIDYMDSFRIFTFNKTHFPYPKKLNADLLTKGFHNVWMIDPGVKAEDKPGITGIFDTGTANSAWVRDSKGETYHGKVWPGMCVFPDFTDPTVRTWWGGFYKDFMAQGVTGVWNDMNEPAVFDVASKTMPEDNQHRGDPALMMPSGKPQGEASAGDHARYHNLYGMQMVRATRDGIAAANPDKRPFVLSRANYIGGQRYAAAWTGDNNADWYHLKTSIPMVLNMGLSGQPFIGPDIGGFNGNGDGKMFARWMGFGALFPFSRGHTAKDNVQKEPWSFGPEVEASCREALMRRYVLMPYLYTAFHESSTQGLPIARPAFFADPKDPGLRNQDELFLLGSDLLVVTQCFPDQQRTPVQPKGAWREIMPPKSADNPKLFLRPGAILCTGPEMEWVDQKPLNPLTLTINLDDQGHATGTLYEDAGDGYGYQKGEYLLTTYEATKDAAGVTVKVAKTEGSMKRPARNVMMNVLGEQPLRGQGADGTTMVAK